MVIFHGYVSHNQMIYNFFMVGEVEKPTWWSLRSNPGPERHWGGTSPLAAVAAAALGESKNWEFEQNIEKERSRWTN